MPVPAASRVHRRSLPGRFAAVLALCAGLIAPAAVGSSATAAPAPAASATGASLGAHYTDAGTAIDFRLHSSRATRIALYLYAQPTGSQEAVSYLLTKDDTTDVWSVSVSVATLQNRYGITGPVYYGYRAWGANWPYVSSWTKGSSAGFVSDVDAQGNRFDPNKLLTDPYARELSHDPLRPGGPARTVYATGPLHRAEDDGTQAPKGIVLPEDTTDTGTKPVRALKDDVIYEVNLRGLTMNDPSVPAAYRGTYRGAALKAGALADLGVTAVEFLPVQEIQNDANDVDPTGTSGDDYWGYSTLDYFAPDRRYAADRSAGGPTREFKAMVKAYHDAGLKVFTDVVYNHTAEGGPWDPSDKNTYSLFSLRGLDNPAYYELTDDMQSPWDNTGVGGNVNTYNPVTRNLITDSLRHWKDDMGVDGFRFDLAPVLGNTCLHGCFHYSRTDPDTALNRITALMPPRPAAGGTGTDWIAEPWALGSGTYQVGNMPAGWSEWNGVYRDTLRRDQNALGVQDVTPADLANRFAGSSDLYQDDGRAPYNSIDFMVAHDGFTLADLYRCNTKNNDQPWPYGPSDGGSDGQPLLGPGRERRRPAQGRPQRHGLPDAVRRHPDDDRRRRVPAFPALQQQPLQPRLVRELAEHRPDQRAEHLRDLHPAHDRLPQGPPGTAPGRLLHLGRPQRQRHGPAGLVHPGREHARRRLLVRPRQPRPRLAHRRHRTRGPQQRAVRGLQRLVRRRHVHAALTGAGQAVVPRHRHLELGRGTRPGGLTGNRVPPRRSGHDVRPTPPRGAAARRPLTIAVAARARGHASERGGRDSGTGVVPSLLSDPVLVGPESLWRDVRRARAGIPRAAV